MSAVSGWLSAGLVVLGGAVGGAYLYDRLHTAPPPPPAPVATLEPLPAVGPSTTGIPERRPEFTLRDLGGRPHPITEWDGHPMLVNFWASWCDPCRREIPLLNRLASEPAIPGLEVVGIAIDNADDVRHFLEKFPIRYPVLVGEQDGLDAAAAFGVATAALPFSAFVDRQGRVLSLHLGELHEAQVRATLTVLDRLGRDELSPAAARTALRSPAAAPGGGDGPAPK